MSATELGVTRSGVSLIGPLEAGRSVRIGYRSRELVGSAASMFERYRTPERQITVAPGELFKRGDDGRLVWTHVGRQAQAFGFVSTFADREQIEGPRWRIEISPGSVRIAATDPVKRDRAQARAVRAGQIAARLRLERETHEPCWDGCWRPSCQGCRRHEVGPGSKIRAWSASSRRSMTLRLATLDYAPLFVNEFGRDTVPAMVTLTYPGDWVAVAPSNRAVRRHVDQLRKRWDRKYAAAGFPLVGVWKREFQERGAPHFHILCVPPPERIDAGFRRWLSETWADIVGAAWCGERCWESFDGRLVKGLACCEHGRHVVAGTGVDFREGARAVDPRRLALYFSKHGGYSAKEYQNEGPAQWMDRGGLGRFWGVWGLAPAVASVELSPAVGLGIARVLRRHQRTKRFTTSVRRLRCTRPEADEHGEVLHEHTRGCFRGSTAVVTRFRGSAGYVVVNDGPALAASLARAGGLIETERREPTRRLAGPVGFLP